MQDCVPVGKEPLFINLDEAAIPYSFAGVAGAVICTNFLPQGQAHSTESLERGETRGNITHIGLLTHSTEVQGRLPQILLGNNSRFT